MKGVFLKSLIKYRLRYLFLLFKNRFKTKHICFYPEYPHKRTIIYQTCVFLGYNIKTKLKGKIDLIINWENKTFKNNYLELITVSIKQAVLNINCKDISKNNVDSIFNNVFGYGLRVNPEKHKGVCVQKNNLNAKKDGVIISCPCKEINPDYVYLKLLDNTVDKKHVQDIRTPVFKNKIPFVYLRTKLIENRFNNTNKKVELAKPEDVFSKQEKEKIIIFCKKINMDFGELDIIRNKIDKKIYIIDVNNTPWGPPNQIKKEDWTRALELLSFTFKATFIDK